MFKSFQKGTRYHKAHDYRQSCIGSVFALTDGLCALGILTTVVVGLALIPAVVFHLDNLTEALFVFLLFAVCATVASGITACTTACVLHYRLTYRAVKK